MKKVFAVLLAMTLVLSALVIVPAAAEGTNVQREIEYIDEKPVIDGEIEDGEYGLFPLDAWSLGDDFDEEEPIFYVGDPSHEIEDDLSIEFYAAWDEKNLYLAWKVYTKYDSRLPFDKENGYMYEYCCVQFVMTPGAPNNTETKYQTAEWSGDYLELGLCQRDDGNNYKCCWSVPATVGSLPDSDWEYAGSRDEENLLTTYECRLPWARTGVQSIGEGAQFGLNFAVGAQENYADGKGMVEYVDGILHGKNADNAVVFTLTGGGIIEPPLVDEKLEGQLPQGISGTAIAIDLLNSGVGDGQKSLVTDLANINNCNPKWATTFLLRPLSDVTDIDGHYLIVEAVQGSGADISFTSEVKDGDIALIAHSSGDGYPGHEDRQALADLAAGEAQVYIFGYNTVDGLVDTKYTNPQVVIIPAEQYVEIPEDKPVEPGDESSVAPESSETPSEPEESTPVEESTPADESTTESTGTTESTATSEPATDDGAEDEGDSTTLIIIIVVVAVVVIGGAVAFFVIKKRK